MRINIKSFVIVLFLCLYLTLQNNLTESYQFREGHKCILGGGGLAKRYKQSLLLNKQSFALAALQVCACTKKLRPTPKTWSPASQGLCQEGHRV